MQNSSKYKNRIAEILSERFSILQELGAGGAGKVFKAQEKNSGRMVALKILHTMSVDKSLLLRRLELECKITSGEKIPNIRQIYSLEQIEEIIFLVMEYVEGESLAEKIETNGKLSLDDVKSYSIQILNGLQEAHKRGFVHRDLKPENILIKEDGELLITDFGLAFAENRDFSRLSRTGITLGTPQYVAPELWKGKKPSKRTDIYSFGIVLYEMLSGILPFKSDSDYGYLQKHLYETPDIEVFKIAGVPSYFIHAVEVCMEKEAEQRAGDIGELVKILITGTFKKDIKKIWEQRRLIFGFTVVLLFVIAGIFLFFRSDGKKTGNQIVLCISSINTDLNDKMSNKFTESLSKALVETLNRSEKIKAISCNRQTDRSKNEDYVYFTANLRRNGKKYLLKLYLYRNGNMTWSKELRTDGKAVFVLSDKIGREIKEYLGMRTVPQRTRDELRFLEVTTASPEARECYLKGLILYSQRDTIGAVAKMKEAVKLDPEFAMAYYYLAFYLNLGQNANLAKPFIEKAVKFIENASENERLLITALAAQIIDKDEMKEIRLLEKYISLNPEAINSLKQLGLRYILVEDWKPAISVFEKIYVEHSKEVGALFLSNIYLKMRDYKTARMYIDTVNRKTRQIDWTDLARMIIAFNEKRYEDALSICNELIYKSPSNYRGYYMAARSLMLAGDFEQSNRYYKQLYGALGFKMAETYVGMLAKGNVDESIKMLSSYSKEDIAKSRNEFWLSQLLLMRLYIAIRDYNKLEELMKNMSIRSKSYHFFYLLKAISYYERDEKKALKLIDKEMIVLPETYGIAQRRWCKGVIDGLKLMSEGKSASEFLLKVYNKYPGEVEQENHHALILHYLAEAYAIEGKTDKQLETYKAIQNLSFGRIYYGDYYALSFYESGKIYQKRNELSRAKELFHNFLKLWKSGDRDIFSQIEDAEIRLRKLKQNK